MCSSHQYLVCGCCVSITGFIAMSHKMKIMCCISFSFENKKKSQHQQRTKNTTPHKNKLYQFRKHKI